MGDSGEGPHLVEYWFGDGTGPITHWRSPSIRGSVLLDFDGDGRVDDAMIDLDGDGRAEIAALDLDDDGGAETRFRDDGSGLWSVPDREPRTPSTCRAPDTADQRPEPPPQPVTPLASDPGQPPRQALIDTDSDGTPDLLLFDSDGDGAADGATATR
ncbi:hypothetical protein GCM10027289_23770 [Tsukamurella serpentis]